MSAIYTHNQNHAQTVWGNNLFKGFLMMYLIIILVHTLHTTITWHAVGALLAGVAVAAVAHRGHGWLPSVLLVIHITFEWAVHAQHGRHYSAIPIAFYGIHTLFDASFLSLEAKHHWGRWWKWWLGAVATGVIILFWHLYVPEMKSFAAYSVPVAHEHGKSVWQQLLVGGIIGCVLSHLLARKVHSH